MAELHITAKAIERFREHVADMPAIEVCRCLNSEVMQTALDFGAPFVKLSGGQRAVIKLGRVVTILTKDHLMSSLSRACDLLHEDGEVYAQG